LSWEALLIALMQGNAAILVTLLFVMLYLIFHCALSI